MKMIVWIIVLFFTLGCSGQKNGKTADQADTKTVESNRVEVIYFHGKQRCMTCRSIEQRTREVLSESFEEEVKTGKVVLKIVDISEKEGEKVADQYEVTWSSLFVNRWKDGKEQRHDMTEFAFTKAVNDGTGFKEGIKAKIKEFMK